VRTQVLRTGIFSLVTVLAAMLISLLPVFAYAQSEQLQLPDEPPDKDSALAEVKGIDEIVVTARKRTENLQEVPLSITAFGAEQLRDRNIQTGYDVALFTPNFNFSRNLGRRLDVPTIRGQFSPLISDTEPNASFFIDGVYVPQNSAGNITIENLERDEVLRGPQAALFGRATFAGAINYITREPTNDFMGEVNLKYGEDNDTRVSLWASGPIVEDKLLYFASYNHQSIDGLWRNNFEPGALDVSNNPYTSQDFFFGPNIWSPNVPLAGQPDCPPGYRTWQDNTRTGCPMQIGDNSSVGGEQTDDVTAKLVFNALDNLEFMVKGQWYKTDDEHIASLRLPQSDLNCFRTADSNPISPGVSDWFLGDEVINGYQVGEYSPGWFCGEVDPAGLTTQVNLPHLRNGVMTTWGYNGRTQQMTPAAPAPVIGAEEEGKLGTLQATLDINEWAYIARYTENTIDSRYGRDLDRSYSLGPAATGLFESYEENDVEDSSFELRAVSPGDGPVRGLLGYYYYDREDVDYQRDFTGFSRIELTKRFTKTTTNNAVFGSLDIDLADRWTFSVDARYASDEIQVIAAADTVNKNETETFYSFTPRFTLTFQPRDELNFYGLVAKGNKPGGFNTDYFDVDGDQYFFDDALGEDCNTDSADLSRPLDMEGNSSGPDGSGPFIKPGCARIDEEESWTYELGAKTSWWNGRVVANLAIFYIDWTNQAINVNQNIMTADIKDDPDDPGNDTFDLELNFITDNAGESSVKGAEVELTLAATDNLLLSLAYGYAKTELKEYNSDEYYRLTGFDDPDLLNGGNVSGNESPRTPKQSANFSALYNRNISGDLGWFARTDYTYESKKWVTVSNLAHTGDLQMWNARAGLENERWTLTFYVDNILDESSPTLVQNFPMLDASAVAGTDFSGTPNGQSNPTQRLFDEDLQQFAYPSGLQITPRRGTNYGVLLGVRF